MSDNSTEKELHDYKKQFNVGNTFLTRYYTYIIVVILHRSDQK